MIHFFQKSTHEIIAVGTSTDLSQTDTDKLTWLFSGAENSNEKKIVGNFFGPRKEMITPWSTNATDIAVNAGIEGINRIETFRSAETAGEFDPMLQQKYKELNQEAVSYTHLTLPTTPYV